MSLRVALYARTSCADLDVRPPDLLANLRRYAKDVRGWTVVAEAGDAGPWLQGARPGWKSIQERLPARKDPSPEAIQVLVVPALHRLGRTFPEVVEILLNLVERRVAIVACDDQIDTTDPLGAARLQTALSLYAPLKAALAAEHGKVSAIRAARRGEAWGRPPVLLNPLEVLALWEGGGGKAPIATRDIGKRLGVSQGSILKALAKVDPERIVAAKARQQAWIERHGRRRTGRPKVYATIGVEDVMARVLAGDADATAIAKSLNARTQDVRRHLRGLQDAGRIVNKPRKRGAWISAGE